MIDSSIIHKLRSRLLSIVSHKSIDKLIYLIYNLDISAHHMETHIHSQISSELDLTSLFKENIAFHLTFSYCKETHYLTKIQACS